MLVCRYDRNFAPNVALSVEPFEAVRKQRAAEALAALELAQTTGDDMAPAAKRRRATSLSTADRLRAAAEDVHNDDDDDDTESVSSDKRELRRSFRIGTFSPIAPLLLSPAGHSTWLRLLQKFAKYLIYFWIIQTFRTCGRISLLLLL